MITIRSRILMSLALAALASTQARPGQAQESPERLLRNLTDASRSDLADFAAGGAFVRTVDTNDRRELIQVYAVRIAAPVDFVLGRIRSGHHFLDDAEGARTRGLFSNPPHGGDLESLSLSRGAIRALEKCRPEECDLKLPLDAIIELQHAVDWSSPTATDDANRFFRRMLLGILSDYLEKGDAAGLIYADKPEPLSVAEGFAKLLEGAAEFELPDGFSRYLSDYPGRASPDIEDVFTWTVEDLGTKSLVSLNHTAFRFPDRGGTSVIGIKRFYSGHYFQASLRTITIGQGGGGESYVIVVDRRRFDGELGGLRRVATERRLERHAEAVLALVKGDVEAAYER